MDVNSSSRIRSSSTVDPPDFGIFINDRKFSDCVLRIEIVADIPDEDDRSYLISWARNAKKNRDEIEKKNALVAAICHEDCNYHPPERSIDVDDDDDDDDEDPPEVRKTNLHAVEVASIVESNSNGSSILQVKNIHISSIILAEKSTHFYELFSNEARGSEERQVTLRIHASEETALMDLLGFMYSNTLSTSSVSGFLDVLMVADKFKAPSCVKYCSRLLQRLPITCVYALVYLDLPSIVGMVAAVQPLVFAATQYFTCRYNNFMKYKKDLLKLPCAVIEVVLSCDDLEVDSEDDIYDFVLEWVNLHHPISDERRSILTTKLSEHVRFPFMSCKKLREVLSCGDFDSLVSSKLVLGALLFKVDPSYRHHALTTGIPIVGRDYKYIPITVVEFQSPREQVTVYFNLKREDCTRRFPLHRIYSQSFDLAGQSFFLSAHWTHNDAHDFRSFGLFLGMHDDKSLSYVSVDYQFFAKIKPSEEFTIRYGGSYNFSGGKTVGCINMSGLPWTLFLDEESNFFINDVLHLRVDLVVLVVYNSMG
ncbi:BTB/POZ domain-containing protein POB1-like isoform X2 [Impatiens glandulifera]|uniref:BTB/POZ domain-containing protein POB1-like isoform X2 n=1 Tax=Impatiens glandulifera TaxID=253017 RepID=UPI001FB1620E|nr:BTB/POZ domain-containing protein POB1-like isoform X2 [Impatiens glandulifera]